eukprot:COSAG01_NODE_65222_length_274_cov_0.560000_1_plen_40_part_01
MMVRCAIEAFVTVANHPPDSADLLLVLYALGLAGASVDRR